MGRVKKYPGQKQVAVSFTAGQKYARAGLGQGPSLVIIILEVLYFTVLQYFLCSVQFDYQPPHLDSYEVYVFCI